MKTRRPKLLSVGDADCGSWDASTSIEVIDADPDEGIDTGILDQWGEPIVRERPAVGFCRR